MNLKSLNKKLQRVKSLVIIRRVKKKLLKWTKLTEDYYDHLAYFLSENDCSLSVYFPS